MKTQDGPLKGNNQIDSINVADLKKQREQINAQLKEAKDQEKELRELGKQSIEAGRELRSNWEDEFKNPFKLYNFYVKNIELIRAREKRSELPLLTKEQFFSIYDAAKETKKVARLALLEARKKEATELNDLPKINQLDKQIIKTKALPIESIKLPFTLSYLLKLIK